MTSKNRKPMGRDIRYLYLALLKKSPKRKSLKKMIGFYEEYINLRERAMNSPSAPSALKFNLPPIKMPEYLKWVKKYLV
jgi:hypothetical protein